MGSGCFYLIYDAVKDQRITNRDLYTGIKWIVATTKVRHNIDIKTRKEEKKILNHFVGSTFLKVFPH